MRTLSTALATYLEGNAYLCADLFEFDVGGSTYRLTNASQNLTGVSPAAASTYTAANIDRERIRSADGLQVDDLEISVAHGGTEGLGAKTWVRLALDGDLDEAPARAYRAYLAKTTHAVIGCYLRFAGVVAQVEPGSTSMRIVIAVSTNRFGASFPAVTYEQLCVWNLGGTGCDFAGTLDYSVTAGGDSTSTLFHIESLPGGVSGPEKFFMGTVTSAGFVRTITNITNQSVGYGLVVSPAFPSAIVVGSTGVARLGCNKTAGVCDGWHNNLVNFMGAPVAPAKP